MTHLVRQTNQVTTFLVTKSLGKKNQVTTFLVTMFGQKNQVTKILIKRQDLVLIFYGENQSHPKSIGSP